MTQPEALRLADELERVAEYDHQVQAAAELRRLYGLTQELLAELYVYRTSKHLRDVTAAYKKAEGGEMSLDVMKQALAALENSRSYVEFDWVKNQCGRAITALSAAIEQAEARTIKTWQQRCEEHPDHDGIVSEAMIRARMQEEIDELRDALKQTQPERPLIQESPLTHNHLWIAELFGRGKNT